jgi:AraC-like DNA-binding protein
MSKRISRQLARERRRVKTRRNELVDLIARAIPQDGAIEPIKNLYLFRVSSPGEPIHSVYKPSLCVVVQGSKEFFLNDERYVYDPANYLIVTAELPLIGQILDASSEEPYLSLLLELDPALVGSVIAEVGDIATQNDADVRAINVSSLNADLLDAVLRLVRLIDTPSEASFLAPMIIKELIFRLWMGDQRDRLLHIVNTNGNTPLITKAIEIINEEFDQQLRVETMASDLGMSVSGFHHHFKAVTAMSPLQYQKRLRLQEARRLLLSGGLNATDVAFRVGYNDSSHFSREYKGLFGLPPLQDIERLRAIA